MYKEKKFKKIICTLMTLTLMFVSVLLPSTIALADTSNSTRGLNPDFLNYVNLKNDVPGNQYTADSDSDFRLGYIPSPITITNNNANTFREMESTALPASYDLRSLNKVTAVRDQGKIGSCWSFATMASLESNDLVSKNLTSDYSENNLITHHGFDWKPEEGGNMYLSAAYLSRWSGPCDESQDPYADPPNPSNVVTRDNIPVKCHVQDINFIPARRSYTDNDDIKDAIMTYGAIDTSIGYYAKYFNSSNNSYYTYDKNVKSNHGVSIVGWDDKYPASNFVKKPAGNGAFVVRNSWGSSWGDNGYFYMSYYDNNIGIDNAQFINHQSTNNFENIYYYDELGMADSAGFNSGTAWYANVFIPSTSSESLRAVGFFTLDKGTQYEVYVQPDYDTNKFSNMQLLTSGTIEMPGYHTVNVPESVALSSKKFAVAVKVIATGDNNPIPMEINYPDFSSKAVGNIGESYVSADGSTWKDAMSLMSSDSKEKFTNVCLKAFTDKGTQSDTTAPTIASSTPANDDSNVAINTPITVKFSEAVQKGTTFDNITVKDAKNNNVIFTSSINNDILTITPSELKNDTKYTVTIPQSAVNDLANNSLQKEYSFSFTTIAGTPTDTTAPTITSSTPANDDSNVAINNPITVKFSEAVQKGAAFDNITVKDAKNNNVAFTSSINNDILSITPSELKNDTKYTVTIPQSAVNDLAKNSLQKEYSFSFTTIASTPTDTTAPTIASSTPTNDDSNVAINSPITVKFSEAVQKGAAFDNITVKDSKNNNATFTSSINNDILTITPSELKNDTKYTVTIPQLAVNDLAKNSFQNEYSFSFTTIADESIQWEVEPNYSMRTANIIKGSSIKGYIDNNNDVDYFKVTLSSAKTATINLNLNNVNADYDLYLYDESGRVIVFSSNDGYGLSESIEESLSEGTYYIAVKSYDNYDNNNPYTLSIN